jgi:transposase
VDAPPPGAARSLGRRGPDRLASGGARLERRSGERRQKGEEGTGPNSTDKGKPGTKRHLITDRQGIPLAVVLGPLGPGNRHDSVAFEAVLDAIPAIRTPARHRRHRPTKLHADKAYDIPRCWAACRARRIIARIARKRIDSSETLGRYRWVIERTHAWLNQFRRLIIRYERRLAHYEAFTTLGCALICWNYLTRWF